MRFFRNKKRIRQLFLLLIPCVASFILTSCSIITQLSAGKGNKYRYQYRMVAPSENNDLLFQDNNIIIQFKFDEAAVRFQLQNISESLMSVDWNKVSLGMNGEFSSVRHITNLYSDTTHNPASVLIPSMGHIRDLLIPWGNLYFNGVKWVEVDLLPTVDNNSAKLRKTIQQSIGQSVTVILPLRFESDTKTYQFEFQVASVDQIPWEQYRPKRGLPPPPRRQKNPQVLDQVTTGIIVVGIVGFSAYILSLRKNPPSDLNP